MSGWRANVRRVTPYTPGEQPAGTDIVKLNTNENPYPPSPEVERVLQEMRPEGLRRYPDPAIRDLTRELASFLGLEENQIFVGVGSDDVLAMSFLTFFNSTSPILFPDITYSFYDVWAELFRIPYQQPPLDEDFRIRPEDYCRPNGGVVLANPNAPTGVELSQSAIEEILRANPDVVVIMDEAYVDFGAESALPLLEKYENLLVVQTFSKSRSLAGMRIGYACGNPELIRCLLDVKYSFNSYTMSSVAIAAGVASVRDRAWFDRTRQDIIKTREWAKEELRGLGFSFPDSRTNFIFATHETVKAKTIFDALRERRIYVRYFPVDRIDNYLRITIGTREEMERLFACLGEIL